MKKSVLMWAMAGSAALLTGCATTGGMSKADKRFTRGEYEAAIPLYKADVAKGKNVALSNYRVGESYRLSNRLEAGRRLLQGGHDGRREECRRRLLLRPGATSQRQV